MRTDRTSFIAGLLVGAVGDPIAVTITDAGGGITMAAPGRPPQRQMQSSQHTQSCHGRFQIVLDETLGYLVDSATGQVWQKKISGEGQSSKGFFDAKTRQYPNRQS